MKICASALSFVPVGCGGVGGYQCFYWALPDLILPQPAAMLSRPYPGARRLPGFYPHFTQLLQKRGGGGREKGREGAVGN
jgi:hypothetical protein